MNRKRNDVRVPFSLAGEKERAKAVNKDLIFCSDDALEVGVKSVVSPELRRLVTNGARVDHCLIIDAH